MQSTVRDRKTGEPKKKKALGERAEAEAGRARHRASRASRARRNGGKAAFRMDFSLADRPFRR